MTIDFSSKIVSSRRLSWLSFFFIYLSLPTLRCTADRGLQMLWDIQGPEGKTCQSEDDGALLPTDSTINSTTCDNSSSIIRLDYTINKNAKYPMYRIFQKDCEEEFEAGTEPVLGSMSPDEDRRMNLSRSDSSIDEESVIASLEILLIEGALSKSWMQRLMSYLAQEQTVEFCVRTGLWLPPQAGKTEVNFRETNVAVRFNKEEGAPRDGYVVKSVELEQKELIGINVDLSRMGGSGGRDSTEKKDEL